MKKVVNPVETVKVDEAKSRVRVAVSNFKDIQKLRIAAGLRICQSFKLGLEVPESADDEERVKEQESLTKLLVYEHERVTDYYVSQMQSKGRISTAIKKVDGLEHIKNQTDFALIDTYVMLLKAEDEAKKLVGDVVKEHPMWDKFFANAKGCGPSIAGQLIAFLDVHKARHVSSFWSYCGVGTRVNDKGERVAMSKKVTVDVEYVTKNGEVATKKSICYNPDLQSLLLGVFVGSALKAGKDSRYAQAYYDAKNRYENRPDLKDASKMRIHRMASRECAKLLLQDLWVEWRAYEGYQITQPYSVEYLGRAPHKYNEAQAARATV